MRRKFICHAPAAPRRRMLGFALAGSVLVSVAAHLVGVRSVGAAAVLTANSSRVIVQVGRRIGARARIRGHERAPSRLSRLPGSLGPGR
jgi:hypothetical protein